MCFLTETVYWFWLIKLLEEVDVLGWRKRVSQSLSTHPSTMPIMIDSKVLSTLFSCACLAGAKVYLAGDSTMALNGANDGITDGKLLPFADHLPRKKKKANRL